MRQNTRLAILAAELERQSPPETSHQAPVARQLESEEGASDGDRQSLHSATVRGGAPSKTARREGALKGEAGGDSPDPRTPILRTPRMARSGSESVQATPSTVPRSAPEGKQECAVCSLQKSPRWRTGPDGPKTLCNRCGVYWATMRHKWDNLVARFKGDSHTKTRGTPATNGGEEEEEGATRVSIPRGRKPERGKVTDPTPTPKNTRKRTTRTIPNPTPLAQGNGGPPFLDSATANGGIAIRSAEHAPAAARQLELATEEKSKPPKKRWIEELTDTSPKRRSGQAVRWRALSDEADVAAGDSSNGGPAKRRRTEIEALRTASEEGLPLKEGRMQRGLARVLEAQREANGGPEVAEPSPREKEAAPAKRRRTELDGLLDLVKKEEVPRTGDGRLQRGLARVLEAQRLANGDGEEMDVALGPLESGELMTRRRLGRRANGSLGEDEGSGLGEDHNPVRNRKSKPPNELGRRPIQ